jgi:hypothetical protein
MQNSQLYPCDLTNAQASILAKPLLPKPARRGRNRTPWHAGLDAIFYVLRSGARAALLPKKAIRRGRRSYGWDRRWPPARRLAKDSRRRRGGRNCGSASARTASPAGHCR